MKLKEGKTGCVYLIRNEDNGLLKIGYTNNLERRLKQIRKSFEFSGIKPNLTVEHVFEHDSYIELESYLHREFKEFRFQNEWFSIDDVGAVIERGISFTPSEKEIGGGLNRPSATELKNGRLGLTTLNEKVMRVSVELLDKLDFNKKYETQLALTLLYKGQALYETWNDTFIETTPSLLMNTFREQGISRRQADNVINALMDMRDKGLISFNGDDIGFKDEIIINVKALLEVSNHGSDKVEISLKDFYLIMSNGDNMLIRGKEVSANAVESSLLQTLIYIKSCWSPQTINKLEKVVDLPDILEMFGGYVGGVYCSDSVDFIRSHKHTSLGEVDNWSDDKYLVAYLSKLEELGCIKTTIHKIKKNGATKTRNIYYSPSVGLECINTIIMLHNKMNDF